MATKKNLVYSYFTLLIVLSCTVSCTYDAPYEKNKAIADRSWAYNDIVEFPVHITDKQAKYNIYIHLRHDAKYDFSNIYILFHQRGPQLKDTTYRQDIPLAELDGRWLGRSAGTLYEVQYLTHSDFVFPDTGLYTFAIEQNMRQNPLKNIADVGIKLEKNDNPAEMDIMAV